LAVDELADQVAARGVRRIEGDILGDDSWYVWQPYPEGWALDDPQYDYGAPVSALSLNDNTLTISVRPGARVGDPAELVLKPALSYYEIDNRIRTTPAGSARKVMLSRDPGSSQIRLWGTIPQRDRGQDLALGIEDPALYAARALRQALTVRGIAVEGGAAAVHLFPNDVPDLSGPAPSERTEVAAVELARRISAPLLEDLRVTAKESQNLHAEMALRAVGRARRGVGSREAGLEELKAFLNEAGLDPESYTMNDGSGLSRLDLVTPSAIVRLLTYMYGSPQRDNWLSILPVGGQDGTLSDRFGEGAAAGRILAKTGTLSHVSSLSGYAARPNGSWFAFSILVNNYRARSAEVRGVIDRICTLILE
jgi:D-alanyl-D-alanine carboxypeptidase/D-alanyl-D-alanine-endopeptidase (penicillin-binding protein 4)